MDNNTFEFASVFAPKLKVNVGPHMNAPTQPYRQTDVNERPFLCMAVCQIIFLTIAFPLGEEGFPFLLLIYVACDVAFAALYAIHYWIRRSRPVLSRATQILVVLSPMYLPILVGIAQKHFQPY